MSIGSIIATPFRVTVSAPVGFIRGIFAGGNSANVINGELAPSYLSTLEKSAEGLKGARAASVATGTFTERVGASLRAGGVHSIVESKVAGTLTELYKGSAPFSERFGAFTKSLGALNGRGWTLGILGALGSVLSIATGIKYAWSSYKKMSDTSKGWQTDLITDPKVHGLGVMAGISMAIGGALCLFPPTAAAGAVASLAGVGLMAGIEGWKYYKTGNHWLNYPNTAPVPFNYFCKLANNAKLGHSGIGGVS